jgi:hypothetical protein
METWIATAFGLAMTQRRHRAPPPRHCAPASSLRPRLVIARNEAIHCGGRMETWIATAFGLAMTGFCRLSHNGLLQTFLSPR